MPVRRLICITFAGLLLIAATPAVAMQAEVISGPGRGFSGDGGPFSEAHIWGPTTIAPSPEGGFYFTDSWNNRIRYVSPGGLVSTVVGRKRFRNCGQNLPPLKSCLALPHGVALDRDGGLLITDTFHHRILKVKDGVARTIAGTGRSCQKQRSCEEEGRRALKTDLHLPVLARRIGGDIYIADTAHRVLRLKEGKISRFAGTGRWGYSGDGGRADRARLFEPADMIAYKGGMLVSDGSNCRLRFVDAEGIIHPFAGAGSIRRCWKSYGLSKGLFKGWGEPLKRVGDGGPARQARLTVTGFMASDGERVWFTDFLNNRVREIDEKGIIKTIAGTGESIGQNGRGPMPALEMRLGWPSALALTENGELLLGDSGNDRIVRLTP